jgi:F0F1-type ATP synthase delta subunit
MGWIGDATVGDFIHVKHNEQLRKKLTSKITKKFKKEVEINNDIQENLVLQESVEKVCGENKIILQ